MLTNNNNTPSSAPPPPPPPPPADWRKNWKPAKNNDKNENTLGSTPSKTSNSTQLKKVQSKSPVQQSPFNFEESLVFKKIQEKNNVDSETADEGSKNSIHVKNPETRNSAQSKEEDNASDKTKNDRSNTKQVVPKKPMTGQHNGVQSDSENQKSSVAEQKKATALKYSIAILLLCTSGPVAGVCTYFIISAVLSSAAVPVSSAVIAFVSASVMLSLAAYLINSHLSAINSEKKVDPGRKQSQYSELQKETESLGHSNTPTSSLSVIAETPSAPPPPPPPLPQNAAPLPSPPPPPTASKCTEKPKNGAPKKANESEHDRSALLAQIRGGGVKLKRVNNEVKNAKTPGNNNDGKSQDFSDELKEKFKSSKSNAEQETGEELAARIEKSIQENKQHTMRNAQCHDSGIANILKRRAAIEFSSSESEVSDHSDSDDWSNDKSKKPKEKKLTKSRKKPTPSNSQPEDERGSKSPDSGHESDDNEKSKPTSPLHSVPKAGKPLVPPKTAGLQTKSEASSPTKTNTVELASSEMQESSTVSVQEIRKRFE
ncbi:MULTISPECIES: WH2 domain-containing protein [unclassified Wolbachia]|uniref:WH2 domain-containing protein n=1 Tax=unclassified Wolbachia TaxID=2640676 RepID=UPI0021F87406|nr:MULTISPECIES: WH2 domain-containing protein [unclassified Wolbachia]